MAGVLPVPAPPRPMATPAERAQVYFANALLPAPLLPTPPRSEMLPLLPTPCLVILPTTSPTKSPPKTGRADADERWDARKNAANKAATPVPGRADAVERWDARKVKPAQSTSSSSLSSSSNSATTRRPASSSSQKWSSNKRAISVSRAASAERWDARKQPRPVHAKGVDDDDDDRSGTGSNDVELDTPPQQKPFYAAPEPGMLPMPSFMVRVA